MGEYKFYQDRKVTSWERDYFSVKANSYEEAEASIDRYIGIYAPRRKRRQPDNRDFQRRRRINNDQCT